MQSAPEPTGSRKKLIVMLEGRSEVFWAFTMFLSVGLIGLLDYYTGSEIAFSFFYLIPVSLLAWFTNRPLGILTSAIAAIIWLIAEETTGRFYSHPFIPFWNMTTGFGFFLVVTYLLGELKKSLHLEKELARIDYITGAANTRSFFDAAQIEMSRSLRYRHPFTVAYTDLDDFKTMNDRFGHNIGDEVLRQVASVAKSILRKSDLVARLGGDEFALLLPETGPEAARAALEKFKTVLKEEMARNHWPVTASIGVLTCLEPPKTADDLLRMADSLMYDVKHRGKDGVLFSVYPPAPDGSEGA